MICGKKLNKHVQKIQTVRSSEHYFLFKILSNYYKTYFMLNIYLVKS